jgi:uncharacterized protein
LFWTFMVERQLKSRVASAMNYAPLVRLEGAVGVGKATLARQFSLSLVDFRDEMTVARAERDPKGFTVGLPYRSSLLNLDKAPFLLPTLEWWVQTYKVAGHFIVTYSSPLNLQGCPTLQRMPALELYPLSQSELMGSSNVIDLLFGASFPPFSTSADDCASRLLQGGYPGTIGATPFQRDLFFEQYLETMVSALRDGSRLPRPSLLRKLLAYLARHSGETITQSVVARQLGLHPMTLHRYLYRLEFLFLTTEVPAFNAPNNRLVRSPRLHVVDTGLSCFLLNLTQATLSQESAHYGRLLRSFAVLELKKQLSSSETVASLHHATTHAGRGVDIILEDERRRVVGMQVCSSPEGERRALTDLRRLRSGLGRLFHKGVILRLAGGYHPLTDNFWAAPVGLLYSARMP